MFKYFRFSQIASLWCSEKLLIYFHGNHAYLYGNCGAMGEKILQIKEFFSMSQCGCGECTNLLPLPFQINLFRLIQFYIRLGLELFTQLVSTSKEQWQEFRGWKEKVVGLSHLHLLTSEPLFWHAFMTQILSAQTLRPHSVPGTHFLLLSLQDQRQHFSIVSKLSLLQHLWLASRVQPKSLICLS